MMNNFKRLFFALVFLFGILIFITTVSIRLPDRVVSYIIDIDHKIIPVRRYSDQECNAVFEPTFEDNLNHIRAYNMTAANPYMESLQLTDYPFSSTFLSHATVPVFVTALSSNHFLENMGLLLNIEKIVRPVFNDLKIVVYDIGLKKQEEIDQLSVACRCTVRKFPFASAPPFFLPLKGCPWKPIVIKMVLQEYPFVMWMDSSVRFTTGNLRPLFDKAISSGVVQMFRNKSTIWEFTHQDTFEFLNEPPCLYHYPEFGGSFVLIYAKDYVLDGIINPWVKCALIEKCMVTTRPRGEILKCTDVKRNATQYHICHRYDQSVISLLMYRLFHDEIDTHLIGECDYIYVRNNTRCRATYSSEFWLH